VNGLLSYEHQPEVNGLLEKDWRILRTGGQISLSSTIGEIEGVSRLSPRCREASSFYYRTVTTVAHSLY
jgi:hypothetical protein